MYYTYLNGQVRTLDGFKTVSNDGLVIGGRLMSQLKLKNGWALQAFAGMRGNDVSLLGNSTGFRFYSLGLNKDFGKKATTSIS